MRTVINNLIISAILFLTSVVYGGNNDFIPRLSAKTLALNGMYTAGCDGLSNLATNPAGLTLLKGNGLELSFLDRTGQQDYKHPEDGLYRSYRDDDISFALGGYWQLSRDLVVAAAYIKPVSYNTDWPFTRYFQSGTSSFVSAFDKTNRLNISGFSVAGAYKVDQFSVGATVQINRYESILSFPVLNELWQDFVQIEPGYQVAYEQNVWQLGFNLGIDWDVSDDLRIGAVLRSNQNLALEGVATSRMPAAITGLDSNATTIPATTDDIATQAALPMTICGGILYRILENMHLNADLALHIWENLDKAWVVEFTDAQWQNIMNIQDEITGARPKTIEAPDQNAIDAGIGFEYISNSGPDFRFGYRYTQSAVSSGAISMLFPECDQHWFSFGLNLEGDGYDADLTIAYALSGERDVARSENTYNFGTYKSDLFIAGITVHYGL